MSRVPLRRFATKDDLREGLAAAPRTLDARPGLLY